MSSGMDSSILDTYLYEENNLLEHKTLADGTFEYTETELQRVGLIHSLFFHR